MAIKKYTSLLFTALVLSQAFGYAQVSDVTTTWKDSSKISTKNKAQFGEFSRNAYVYPARPNDMLELGLSAGVSFIAGDLNPEAGWGVSISARKSYSHTFSVRPTLSYFSINGKAPYASDYRDFKSSIFGLALDFIASLNTINSYRGNPKNNIYLLAGPNLLSANVKKKNIGGEYDQYYAPNPDATLGTWGSKNLRGTGLNTLIFGFDLGLGYAHKFTDRINAAFEFKSILTNYDYLDANSSIFSNAFDAIYFMGARINYNVGNKDKKVQPLWWINPNNYTYSELNTPEHLAKKLKVKLDDADGDGITDQFDMEPNTPKGVSVDARGRALDSDGDGVPDYKDKELLSRQECFPVNADGVGTCPESPCCKESREKITELQKVIETIKVNGIAGGPGGSVLPNLPSIQFKSGNAKLDRDNMKLLDAVAQQLKNNPNAKVKVLGHPEANKTSQQKAYDRVESIIKYLVEKQGISENRFIFAYDAGGNGDGNTIDLQGTTEEGPNTVPAPAPHLKGKN